MPFWVVRILRLRVWMGVDLRKLVLLAMFFHHTAGYEGTFGPCWADFPLPYPLAPPYVPTVCLSQGPRSCRLWVFRNSFEVRCVARLTNPLTNPEVQGGQESGLKRPPGASRPLTPGHSKHPLLTCFKGNALNSEVNRARSGADKASVSLDRSGVVLRER
jgi:hypothetical protein